MLHFFWPFWIYVIFVCAYDLKNIMQCEPVYTNLSRDQLFVFGIDRCSVKLTKISYIQT